jgi:hypothetical protein
MLLTLPNIMRSTVNFPLQLTIIYTVAHALLTLGLLEFAVLVSDFSLHFLPFCIAYLVFKAFGVKGIDMLLTIICSVGILIAFVAIVSVGNQIIQGGLLGFIRSQGRVSGIFSNSNMFATYVIFALIWFMHLFYRMDINKLIVFSVTLIVMLALTFSFSRRAWLILGMVILISALFHKDKSFRSLFRVMAIGLFALMVYFWETIGARLLTIFDSSYTSNSIRIDRTNFMFETLVSDPFTFISGFGFGSAGPVAMSFNNFGVYLHQVDSYFALILFEFGAIGLIIYVVIYTHAFVRLLVNKSKSQDTLLYLNFLSCLFVSNLVGVTSISYPVNFIVALLTVRLITDKMVSTALNRR